MPGTVGAVLIVSMNDGFSVTVGIKSVTEVFQVFAQLALVIDLAVEDDPSATILIVNRLLPTFQIDNR